MHNIKYQSLFLVLFISQMLLFGQNFRVNHFTTDDGLPHNFGYDIIEDKNGYIWLGTDNGLASFDGQQFTTLKGEGFQKNIIVSLAQSPVGELYVSSYKRGVFRVDTSKLVLTELGLYPVSNNHFMHPRMTWFEDELFVFDQRKDLNSGVMGWYHGDEEEAIRLIRSGDSLITLTLTDRKELASIKTITLYEYNPEVDVVHIDLDISPANRMFWATNLGLYEYKLDGDFELIKEGNFKCITGNESVGILLTEKNRIWQWVDGTMRVLLEAPVNEIDGMAVNLQGMLFWFSRAEQKLNYFDIKSKKQGEIENLASFKSDPSQIISDSHGSFWLTTHGEGLYHIQNMMVKALDFANSDQIQSISAITEDKEQNLWIGTTNGLKYYDTQLNQEIAPPFPLLPALIDEKIYKLFYLDKPDLDLGNHVMISAYTGQFAMDLSGKKSTLINPVNTKYVNWNSDGTLVVRMLGELSVYSPFELVRKHTFDKTLFNDQGAGTIGVGVAYLGSNEIWYARNQYIFHQRGEEVETFQVGQYLGDVDIIDMILGKDSTIWVMTNQGLFSYQENAFIPHPQNAILWDNCEKLIFDKNGDMWLSGKKGIFYLTSEQVVHLSTINGLPTNDVSAIFFDSQDRLWIGTSAGLAVLEYPFNISPSPTPQLHLKSISVNKSALAEKIDAVPANAVINLEVATTDLSSRVPPSLQYRLREDAAWINTNDRSFEFSNLTPGEYQFQFRTRNANNLWSEPLSIPIQFLKPWWLQWQNMLGLIVCSILVLGFLILLWVRNIRKRAETQNELNQQMAHLQLSALQSQLNPHFMFNALNSIQYFIINQDEVTANDYLAKFSRLMRLFLEASHARYIPLSEELELLELYIELEKLRFEGKFDYEIKLDVGIDPDEIEIPSMILQPFVENAINHGLRNKDSIGLLQLRFRQSRTHFQCIISDDGIGREAAKKIRSMQQKGHKSRGMKLLEKRLEVLGKMENSEVDIVYTDLLNAQGDAAGTRVEISFPL